MKLGDCVRRGADFYVVTETPDRPSLTLLNVRSDQELRVFVDTFEQEGYELLRNVADTVAVLKENAQLMQQNFPPPLSADGPSEVLKPCVVCQETVAKDDAVIISVTDMKTNSTRVDVYHDHCYQTLGTATTIDGQQQDTLSNRIANLITEVELIATQPNNPWNCTPETCHLPEQEWEKDRTCHWCNWNIQQQKPTTNTDPSN